jgi:hypothetical protein
MRGRDWSPVMIGAVVCAAVIAATGAATPAASERPTDDATQARLATLLGPQRLLRDFAPFTTERGEAAFLVLFVTGATGPTVLLSSDEPWSCPEAAEGIALHGTYHVGLVRDGRLVNEVVVPCTAEADCVSTESLTFPLANTRFNNHWYWGQGAAIAFDAPGANVIEPTKLITLADFTGDGHAWEFRLALHGGACGHTATLLAGYSPRRREAILFPIVSGKALDYWHDNFYPAATQPAATALHYEFACLDHGNELRDDQWYEYNPALEAWVRTRQERHLCVERDRSNPMPSNVEIHIGSARGRPGETVQLTVSVVPAGADVHGVELQLPLDGEFDVRGCGLAAADANEVRATSWGIETLQLAYGPDDGLLASRDGEATLYTCDVVISPYADAGPHRLSASGLLVSDGWTRLHAVATEGEIFVDVEATPTPAR